MIRFYKPKTPGTRFKISQDFSQLSRSSHRRKLLYPRPEKGGRNNHGLITVRNRGGGHKRRGRKIDFLRKKTATGIVVGYEYDPTRSARLALLRQGSSSSNRQTYWYVICPLGLEIGKSIIPGAKKKTSPPIKIGNSLKLGAVPAGTAVHNVELIPGRGGKLARAAGVSAQVSVRSESFVTLKLPSGELRRVNSNCFCTIGRVGNVDNRNVRSGKAGRHRWLGKRPKVRGSAMNAVDHPHGGGEGRAPIGRSRPLTPWGKPALGPKTRKTKKASDAYIVQRRKIKRRKK